MGDPWLVRRTRWKPRAPTRGGDSASRGGSEHRTGVARTRESECRPTNARGARPPVGPLPSPRTDRCAKPTGFGTAAGQPVYASFPAVAFLHERKTASQHALVYKFVRPRVPLRTFSHAVNHFDFSGHRPSLPASLDHDVARGVRR